MAPTRVFLIDNYDSFTFNLADEFEKRHCEVQVWRNDVAADRITNLALGKDSPALIVLSPGPGRPEDAGSSMELVRINDGRVPLLGVCLGHQAIVTALGGEVDVADAIVHGKMSLLNHDQTGIFEGIPNRISVGRYHSLAAQKLPKQLTAQAWCGDTVMAVKHQVHKIFGLQFHPESILTTHGGKIVENILNLVKSEVGNE